MVKIRLARFGAKKRPFYRIVARTRTESATAATSNSWAHTILSDPPEVRLNSERILYWKSVGAQLSDTVASILKANKVA